MGGREGRDAGAEAREDRRVPLRGEAVAVYEGRVLGEVEYAWTRISWLARESKSEHIGMSRGCLWDYLWFWSDAADFHPAEAETEQACTAGSPPASCEAGEGRTIDRFTVLVESRSDADGV